MHDNKAYGPSFVEAAQVVQTIADYFIDESSSEPMHSSHVEMFREAYDRAVSIGADQFEKTFMVTMENTDTDEALIARIYITTSSVEEARQAQRDFSEETKRDEEDSEDAE